MRHWSAHAARPSSVRSRRLRMITALTGIAALGIAGSLAAVDTASPAAAAGSSFVQVTNFGANPGNLAMFSYLPVNLPQGAPLVVALHGCTQGASDYYQHSGWP